ncbi:MULTISPECIES: peptidase M23 [unclassified Sulfitobacter]|jgi:hypothetical protein|uniref:peptidase M23 n=1 Tax=unclassified Sulfitobacter TaxID=196795 RepID=UPI000A6F84AC|nr:MULTISPECIES: peptidase M23 [unclassified Sulfitobacter]
MKHALIPAILATPAAAHSGAHLNPHGDIWAMGFALLFTVVVALLAYGRRR